MFKQKLELGGHLDIVEQAIFFLKSISAEAYQQVLSPHFSSSVGAHMRHVLDHYIALQKGLANGLIDYNQRHRQSAFELCPQAAITKWLEVKKWILEIQAEHHLVLVDVVCETSVKISQNSRTQSSFSRELVFVSSHAIHHFTLLSVMRSMQGEQVEKNFGLAPATASFRRQQA